MIETDVVIIGAGASGLMCAIEAGKRGRSVMVLDHANKPGKKILMSGGGRCNFTNYSVEPKNYLAENIHFCKSALSRYTQWDFIALCQRYDISYHEREHGQLFCNDSAKDILNMLLAECEQAGVLIKLSTEIQVIAKHAEHFQIDTSKGRYLAKSLVVATGGLSIPKMGASPLGYKIANQFGINIVTTRAGLVPVTLQPEQLAKLSALSGIAVPSVVSANGMSFKENILFTHRGLSGPAILQISSYWHPGDPLSIDLLPELDIAEELKLKRSQKFKNNVKTILDSFLPKRLVASLVPEALLNTPLPQCSDAQIQQIAEHLHHWTLKPNGTEGYRTAEVTVGGVDVNAISSKTMECKTVSGLYFIGEVLDVTGWLGGYNFQWAWSSAWCAGQVV